MVAFASIQSDVGWVKLEYCLNGLSRSYSLVDACVNSLLLVSFSVELMVSIISFMVASGDFKSPGGLSVFYHVVSFPYLPKNAFNEVDTK